MAYGLPNGSTVDLASSYSAVVQITSISNSNPAVATATAHGFAEGDIVQITSGWEFFNNRSFLVGAVTTDTFELLGSQNDTTDVNFYPAGSSQGTAKSVESWTQINQITGFETAGNEQSWLDIQFLASRRQTQLPTIKSPLTLTLTMADDPQQDYVPVVTAYDFDLSVNTLRMNLVQGDSILYPVILSYNSSPTVTINELLTTTLAASAQNVETRYTRP